METNKLFRQGSSWNPPPETFLLLNEIAVNAHIHVAPKIQNLSKSKCKSIDSLAKDHSIVIKQADKGGALVAWDRDDYISEGHRQLNDWMFYEKQACDMTLVDKLLNDKINPVIHKMLLTDNPRTPEFISSRKYTRPNSCPGRPIVSGNGGPTEKHSGFIHLILCLLSRTWHISYNWFNNMNSVDPYWSRWMWHPCIQIFWFLKARGLLGKPLVWYPPIPLPFQATRWTLKLLKRIYYWSIMYEDI